MRLEKAVLLGAFRSDVAGRAPLRTSISSHRFFVDLSAGFQMLSPASLKLLQSFREAFSLLLLTFSLNTGVLAFLFSIIRVQ